MIFKHMYQQYKMDYTPAAPTTTSMMPTWASHSSFLSELAMLDDNEDTYIQEHEKSEYERYAILMQGGSGKADGGGRCVFILFIHIIITYCWSGRTMSETFRSSLAWPVISWPFQVQVSQSRGSSRNLDICALTSKARSMQQPLQRLYVPGNGFMRVFSSSIELMQVVWACIYSFSIMVFYILNINSLNSYRLLYPYRY
jgi:hypothetical protein